MTTSTSTSTFADLTSTNARRVVSIRVSWENDRIVDGPLGSGWAVASFDAVRCGSQFVTFDDGTTERFQITSEDSPEERLSVGDLVSRSRVLVAAAVPCSDIPF
jgi:hypothetical protein